MYVGLYMICWKCKEDMTLEYDNPWRMSKQGNRIRCTTWVCWNCFTIAKLQATEICEDEIFDICNDDLPA